MSQVVLVPGTAEHAFVLSTTMRPKDVAELAICGRTPLEGLLESLRVSEVAGAALYDDVVGAVFGVQALNPGTLGVEGRLWFLTGHLFAERPVAFVKAAKRVVAALLEVYPKLTNFIDARHDDAQRFATRLGASLSPAVPFGPAGAPFVPFTFRRH